MVDKVSNSCSGDYEIEFWMARPSCLRVLAGFLPSQLLVGYRKLRSQEFDFCIRAKCCILHFSSGSGKNYSGQNDSYKRYFFFPRSTVVTPLFCQNFHIKLTFYLRVLKVTIGISSNCLSCNCHLFSEPAFRAKLQRIIFLLFLLLSFQMHLRKSFLSSSNCSVP